MPLDLKFASAPRADFTPQSTQIIALCLLEAEKDLNLLGQLVSNPGQVFASAGYPLAAYQIDNFNQFVREEVKFDGLIQQLKSGTSLANVSDIGCTLCKIGCYTIAVAIVAVGAGALTFLTAGSAPVLALAAFAGVTAAVSLAFIVTLATAVAAGVAAVAYNICNWTSACS